MVVARGGLRASQACSFVEANQWRIERFRPTHVVLHVYYCDMVPRSLEEKVPTQRRSLATSVQRWSCWRRSYLELLLCCQNRFHTASPTSNLSSTQTGMWGTGTQGGALITKPCATWETGTSTTSSPSFPTRDSGYPLVQPTLSITTFPQTRSASAFTWTKRVRTS